MRVKTPQAQTFDFGLSGRETQTSFNVEKYKALTYGNPKGVQFRQLIDANWKDWLEIVENASWLSNWRQSDIYKVDRAAVSPGGCVYAGYPRQIIAANVFAEAVWGFGLADWLRGDRVSPEVPRSLYRLQCVKCPNALRNHQWDQPIYRGCGIQIPCEYGDLDRWLESLWNLV